MKYLSIILLYITIIVTLSMTNVGAEDTQVPVIPTHTITITNDTDEMVVSILNRVACKVGELRLMECQRGTAEMQPGTSLTYDVSGAWEHTYKLDDFEGVWFYTLKIWTPDRGNGTKYEFQKTLIVMPIHTPIKFRFSVASAIIN